MNAPSSPMEFTESEKNKIEQNVNEIRKVFRAKNMDIKSIVGTISSADIANTKTALEVRFSEEAVTAVQMNMVAFD